LKGGEREREREGERERKRERERERERKRERERESCPMAETVCVSNYRRPGQLDNFFYFSSQHTKPH
jgi:hypothetical protein